MKIKSINVWINNEIASLKKISKHSKIKFFFLAFINISINIATIITALLAIWLLITTDQKNISTGVILASLSAGFIIILFFINSLIVIYRSFMKNKFYAYAINKIEIEVMKYNGKHDKYSDANAQNILVKEIEKIKSNTLSKKVNSKTKNILLKSLMGDLNA